MNTLGIFHPANNLGLEIFFIGVVGLTIFAVCFLIAIAYTNHKNGYKGGEI